MQKPPQPVESSEQLGEQDNNEMEPEEQQEAPGDGYEQDGDDERDQDGAVEPADQEEHDIDEESEQPPKEEPVGPLVVSEEHENFTMDKKYEDDPTLGLPNNKHLLCQLCEVVIIPEMYAVKVKNEVDLIKNTMREYDICDTYWHVDSIDRFQNVEVHQLDDHLKYLCCLSCNCCILGFMIKAVSTPPNLVLNVI